MSEAEDYPAYPNPHKNIKTSKLCVQLLHSEAKLPTRGSTHAAGYDLYAVEDGCIKPGHRAMVRTGIAFTVPDGYYGRIAPRSGLAVKNGIDVMAGVIDSDYTSEVKVVLINLDFQNNQVYNYKTGDRIAQLVIEQIGHPTIKEVSELIVTDRSGGFGSTGK